MGGTSPNSRRPIIKIAMTAAAGASIEWYDFFIYGTAAALVFPTLFFPASLSPLVAQLAAFGTFAVGFVARPLGGVLFGHFGDIFGRKRALVIALIIMGIATTLVGMLPSYATGGVLAPCLLVLLRIVQGLAIGGQWGGAALLAIESAPANRQGYYGSFVQVGVPAGLLLANVVFLTVISLVAPADFQAWGWRIPFLLSFGLVGIGIFIQLRLEETAEFRKLAGELTTRRASRIAHSPIIEVIRTHPKEIILAGGAFAANNTCFYVAITYAVAYGTATLHLSRDVMLGAVMIGSAGMVPVLIIFGRLSDHWNRRRVYMTGATLTGLWSLALFPLIETGSPLLIATSIAIELAVVSIMYGPQAALFAELFPVKVRYSGASLGYQFGAVVGGGFAPVIATALFDRFGSTFSIAIYLFVMCAISLLSTFLLGYRALVRDR
jgi:metabolite-proton symporter